MVVIFEQWSQRGILNEITEKSMKIYKEQNNFYRSIIAFELMQEAFTCTLWTPYWEFRGLHWFWYLYFYIYFRSISGGIQYDNF